MSKRGPRSPLATRTICDQAVVPWGLDIVSPSGGRYLRRDAKVPTDVCFSAPLAGRARCRAGHTWSQASLGDRPSWTLVTLLVTVGGFRARPASFRGVRPEAYTPLTCAANPRGRQRTGPLH